MPEDQGTNGVQGNEQQELNPDLAGYPNQEALVNGYRASRVEAGRLKERADRADQLERELATYRMAEANPRQQVPNRSTPQDRLSELGVPVDALEAFVGEKLQQAFQPILAGVNARSTVMANYPDYGKFESDVNQFIQSDMQLNQTYQRMFAADPVGAFEYAFLKFGDSRRRGNRNGTSPEEAAHAAIPGGRNGESRRLPESLNSDVQKAWENYQRTGSSVAARDYAKARLRTVIKDDFLNA